MRTAWLCLALGLAACDIAEPGSNDRTVVIRGTAIAQAEGSDRTGGGPVAGVNVRISSGPSILGPGVTHATATTDATGVFELRFEIPSPGPVSPCGSYYFDGSGAGYYVDWVEGFRDRECDGLVAGVVAHVRLLVPPASTLTFVSRPSNTQQECLARPPGTVCMGFDDGYVWLVEYPSPIRGHRSGGVYQGNEVQVYMFDGLELHHVLRTDLVAEVRW